MRVVDVDVAIAFVMEWNRKEIFDRFFVFGDQVSSVLEHFWFQYLQMNKYSISLIRYSF